MDIRRTAEYWDRRHLTTAHHRKEWSIHPLTLRRQRAKLGDMTVNQWLKKHYLPNGPACRAMSIGVGTAQRELEFLMDGLVGHYDLYEVSQASLDHARSRARSLGIEDRARFLCQDIRTVAFPRRRMTS